MAARKEMLQVVARTLGRYSRNTTRTFSTSVYQKPPVCSKKAGGVLASSYQKFVIRHFSFDLMEKHSPVKLCESASDLEEGHTVLDAEKEEVECGGGQKAGEHLDQEGDTTPHDLDEVDKYQYISRGFTTEIFKIELGNVPARMGYKKLKDYLCSLELDPGKIKQPRSMGRVAFINFKSEESRQMALKTLNGRTWKNRVLTAKVARPAMDPLFKRKRMLEQETSSSATDPKRARRNGKTAKQRLLEAVCPWAEVPYEEQLKRKEEELKKSLKKMASYLSKPEWMPGLWVKENKAKYEGMLCPMEPVRPSPLHKQYRNKCEYTVGYGDDEETEARLEEVAKGVAKEEESGGGATALDVASHSEEEPSGGGMGEVKEEKTRRKVVVGFRTGGYEDGDFNIVSSESCPHIPDRMKELAELFQVFFNQSPLKPFMSQTDQGYWKGFTIRCYGSGDTMVSVQMHPQDLTSEAIDSVKDTLVEFFTSGEGSKAPPTSLYFQLQGRKMSNETVVHHHILGEKHVYEDLLGMKFRIAPASFFQVNTPACGVLYDIIREAVAPEEGKKPVIYDICCGTGTIGLYLSKVLSASKVVGIEMVPEAIEDANQNAQLNGITNAKFICGKAEDVIKEQLSHVSGDNVIAILDPPRGGVHSDVIRAIRKCPAIQKLVYVACKPNATGAQTNISSLCKRKSNTIKGQPFCPVRAIPIDLFPQTPYCELVIVLERVPPKPSTEEHLQPEQRTVEEVTIAEDQGTDSTRINS